MNELQIFNSEEFGDIRTVQLNNEIYFVGKDVATALGYANPKNAVPTHVSEEDKLSTQIEYAGQRREVTVINESGLYALIFGSKLESAKRFKHWVTSEVLPAIRKTGAYQKPMTTDQKIQLLAQGNVELTEKIEKVNDDLQEFKKGYAFTCAGMSEDYKSEESESRSTYGWQECSGLQEQESDAQSIQ